MCSRRFNNQIHTQFIGLVLSLKLDGLFINSNTRRHGMRLGSPFCSHGYMTEIWHRKFECNLERWIEINLLDDLGSRHHCIFLNQHPLPLPHTISKVFTLQCPRSRCSHLSNVQCPLTLIPPTSQGPCFRSSTNKLTGRTFGASWRDQLVCRDNVSGRNSRIEIGCSVTDWQYGQVIVTTVKTKKFGVVAIKIK